MKSTTEKRIDEIVKDIKPRIKELKDLIVIDKLNKSPDTFLSQYEVAKLENMPPSLVSININDYNYKMVGKRRKVFINSLKIVKKEIDKLLLN